jgi:hypothetical protein
MFDQNGRFPVFQGAARSGAVSRLVRGKRTVKIVEFLERTVTMG